MNRHTTHNSISDETLMRFVDGDLSRDEQAVVAAEIVRDPQLEKRLEPFRFTKTLAGFYAPALDVSPQLMERFLSRGAGKASPSSAVAEDQQGLRAYTFRTEGGKSKRLLAH
jgi:anti-sigma factor RsiW